MAVSTHQKSATRVVSALDKIPVHVTKWGQGQPSVLLLHGFGDSSVVWRTFAEMLECEMSIIAPDLRGHGNSGWDKDGAYDLADLSRDILCVVDTFRMTDAVLVGHSLGAAIAMEVAKQLRNINGLVLVDFGATLNTETITQIRTAFNERMCEFPSLEKYVAVLANQMPLVQLADIRRIALSSVVSTDPPRVRQKCDPAILNMSPHKIVDAAIVSGRGLACPKLLVRGALSGVLSMKSASDLVNQLSNCALAVVRNAGHAVMLDNPEGFCDAVRPFIYACNRKSPPNVE